MFQSYQCSFISSLLCADSASSCLFGSRYTVSVHRQSRLWVVLCGTDTDSGSKPLLSRSPHILEISYR